MKLRNAGTNASVGPTKSSAFACSYPINPMADIFTQAKRSILMSRVRGRGNRRTELAFAKVLRGNRLTGWRRHQAIPGTPDFVFSSLRLAIFVDGCFWHCCPKHATEPKNNGAFWKAKLARNRARDRSVTRELRLKGWTVLRIWEHELATKKRRRLLQKLERTIRRCRGSVSSVTESPLW